MQSLSIIGEIKVCKFLPNTLTVRQEKSMFIQVSYRYAFSAFTGIKNSFARFTI